MLCDNKSNVKALCKKVLNEDVEILLELLC
jgi:hypothetical protein